MSIKIYDSEKGINEAMNLGYCAFAYPGAKASLLVIGNWSGKLTLEAAFEKDGDFHPLKDDEGTIIELSAGWNHFQYANIWIRINAAEATALENVTVEAQ
jgi:hypothetical protein